MPVMKRYDFGVHFPKRKRRPLNEKVDLITQSLSDDSQKLWLLNYTSLCRSCFVVLLFSYEPSLFCYRYDTHLLLRCCPPCYSFHLSFMSMFSIVLCFITSSLISMYIPVFTIQVCSSSVVLLISTSRKRII